MKKLGFMFLLCTFFVSCGTSPKSALSTDDLRKIYAAPVFQPLDYAALYEEWYQKALSREDISREGILPDMHSFTFIGLEGAHIFFDYWNLTPQDRSVIEFGSLSENDLSRYRQITARWQARYVWLYEEYRQEGKDLSVWHYDLVRYGEIADMLYLQLREAYKWYLFVLDDIFRCIPEDDWRSERARELRDALQVFLEEE
jgi:hypothetical protein